jgi:hypothetical protein
MGLLEKVTSQNKRSLALQNAKARRSTRDNLLTIPNSHIRIQT